MNPRIDFRGILVMAGSLIAGVGTLLVAHLIDSVPTVIVVVLSTLVALGFFAWAALTGYLMVTRSVEEQEQARVDAATESELRERAMKQHRLYLAGKDEGIYGIYPPEPLQ